MHTTSTDISQRRLSLLLSLEQALSQLGQTDKNLAEKSLKDAFSPLGDVLASAFLFDSARLVVLDASENNAQVIIDWQMKPSGLALDDLLTGYQFVGNDKILKQCLSDSHCQSIVGSTSLKTVCLASVEDNVVNLLMPLKITGYNAGVLSLQWQNGITVEEQRIAEALLEDIAIPFANAIKNAQLLAQSKQQASQQFLLNDITQSIRQSLDVKQILTTLTEKLLDTLSVDRVFASVTTPHHETLCFEAASMAIPETSSTLEQAELEKTVFSRRSLTPDNTNPYVIHALNTDEALSQKGSIQSIAIFPLTALQINQKGTLPLIGTLSLQQVKTQRAWTDGDIALVQGVCEQVCVALHQAELFETTQQQKQQLEKTLAELGQTQLQLIQSEKMAVIGQFVAGIAHDVNTPLAIITANQDTASQYLDRINNLDEASIKALEQAKSLLEHNHQAALRIRDIVDNLRNFARLDESDRKIANIHTGLDSTLLLLESQFKERNIKITKQYDANLSSIECFPGLLNQVFQNLLVNAMQAFDEAASNKQITISTQQNSETNQVEIQIRDNGKGIAEDHLARIFDPGFTTKGVGVGTGLGLALCYKIIEKHGGNLIVESEINTGSTFKIVLSSV